MTQTKCPPANPRRFTTRDAPNKTRARFTNLIAEPDASEAAVTEAVNDTLKAIAASLLMEQVLAPRFEFKPKNPANGPTPGFDYGEGGYDPTKCNVGFNKQTGQFQIEINGLAEPKSKEAARICQEDLDEVIAAFVQDKTAVERGLFDEELVPEELTQVRLGKIIKDKYPELSDEDQEAVRQHAIAALTLTQQAKKEAAGEPSANTALIDGVRKFALSVTEDAMSDLALDELREELAEFAQPEKKAGRTPREERIIAGFEEIPRFTEKQGRVPQHGEDGHTFERLYAVRLDRLCGLEECRSLLAPLDHQGLLAGAESPSVSPVEEMDEDELLAEPGRRGRIGGHHGTAPCAHHG